MSEPDETKTRSVVTTHVLDAALGRPADGVPVRLDHWTGSAWEPVAFGSTDVDGRIEPFGPPSLQLGRYRVLFDTAAYFSSLGRPAFYPEIAVVFELAESDGHYHIPLLLSPFAYSTYRGS